MFFCIAIARCSFSSVCGSALPASTERRAVRTARLISSTFFSTNPVFVFAAPVDAGPWSHIRGVLCLTSSSPWLGPREPACQRPRPRDMVIDGAGITITFSALNADAIAPCLYQFLIARRRAREAESHIEIDSKGCARWRSDLIGHLNQRFVKTEN